MLCLCPTSLTVLAAGVVSQTEISGLIIPGSARNSDLSASIACVKGKIKIYIQNSQKLGHIYLW